MKQDGQPLNYQPYGKFSTLIILTFLALLLLCPAELQATPMNRGQAEKVVKGWLKIYPNPLQTQMGNQIGRVDVFCDDNKEPIYYVVYLRPSGFVIVSADDFAEPIVAFADDGTFDPSPDNPLGAMVSRDLPGRIAAARSLQATASSPQQKQKTTGKQTALEKAGRKAKSKWAEFNDYSDRIKSAGMSSISDVWVEPILESEWGQTCACYSSWYCYNYYIINHWPCGCVATSMAQLMRFHQHPGSYPWSNMPLRPEEICGSLTETQRQNIGELCYDAAESVGTTYDSGGSLAYIYLARNALPNDFGYSNAINGWHNNEDLSGPGLNGMVNPGLDAGFPSLLGVAKGTVGHAVVADGYGYNGSTLYHHINMGWDGTSDAWYNLPYIDVSYNFNVVHDTIYNVYVTGSGEIISGRVTDTSDDPISGATVTGVRTVGGTYIDTTNDKGIYALAKIPSSSTYTVSVTKSGYSFTNQVISTGYSQHEVATSGNEWGIDFVGTVTGPSPPTAEPDTISAEQGVATPIDLQASDDGLPNPPGVLTYIITSLPAQGSLNDPGAGAISSVPYIIASNGNQVVYTSSITYYGSDSFNFKANDGGTPPDGGDSSIATITIDVQPPAPTVIYETNFDGGLPTGWTIIDGLSDGYTWTTSNYWLEGDEPEWEGATYMVAGYEDDPANMDEQLITHNIDCSDLVNVTLSFKHVFNWYESSPDEVADVDVRVDGGSWQNVARYESDTSGLVELDISSIADGQPNVQIQWHYYNGNWEWYWGIDDVNITANEVLPPQMPGDFEPDGDVDIDDLTVFVDQWLLQELTADFAPGDSDYYVNFLDWAVFSDAWQSTPLLPNWNSACDIFPEGGDGIVDTDDLGVFVEQWLQFGAYCADIAPVPDGDGIVNMFDFAVLAQDWLVGVE